MSINPLHYRVLSLSRKHKLGHLSSNLTAVDILDEIYATKRPQDICVLSQGQAGLGLYCVLEKWEGKDAEALYLKHGTHPNRDVENGIHVSAGSLGCAITVALGMAMADRSRNVYCLISDGESWEGSIYEVLSLKVKFGLINLRVYLNVNGYTCIERVHMATLIQLCRGLHIIEQRFTDRIYETYPFLKGVEAHYHNLTDEDWKWVEENR